jgi:hypothetical protein
MNSSKLIRILFIISIALSLSSCHDKKTRKNPDTIKVRYIEQICCGNMMTLDNFLIYSNCNLYNDSLLRATNIDNFEIPQNYQFGDTLSIAFKLTEFCEASCELTCNRYNGIPIELIQVEE